MNFHKSLPYFFISAKHCHFLIVLGMLSELALSDPFFNEKEKEIILSLTRFESDLSFADPSNKYSKNLLAKKLGKQLFFDARLSSNGKISCHDCHNFTLSTTDGKKVAKGMARGSRNTPPLINLAMNRWYFWDGRSDSLWSQALGPITSRAEMGGKWPNIYQLFLGDSALFKRYNAIFTDSKIIKIREYQDIEKNRFKSNIGKALAAFQMDIIQFNSRFDTYAKNLKTGNIKKLNSINTEEKKGLKIFIGKGHCTQCHSGPNFSDGEFHNLQLPSQKDNPKNSGRFSAIPLIKSNVMNIIGLYSDATSMDHISTAKTRGLIQTQEQWAAFKTPTLRNVADTAPYMHDGSINSLAEVIDFYSTFSENPSTGGHHSNALLTSIDLNAEEEKQLEAFLHSLTGTIKLPTYE